MKVDADSEDAVATVELVGGTKGPVTLDDDMNMYSLLRIRILRALR